jgi:hypothetical protein
VAGKVRAYAAALVLVGPVRHLAADRRPEPGPRRRHCAPGKTERSLSVWYYQATAAADAINDAAAYVTAKKLLARRQRAKAAVATRRRSSSDAGLSRARAAKMPQ